MSVVKKQLSRLIAAYPSATVDENMLGVWTKKMGKVAPAVLTRTVDTLIDNCRFFPSVAEFVEFADSENSRLRLVQQTNTRRDCNKCVGGWILHDEETGELNPRGEMKVESVAKPCIICLPDTYEKWSAGAYEPRFV